MDGLSEEISLVRLWMGIGREIFRARYSLENSHNPFAFNGRVAAIFMVRLWFEEP
jgi:hypothetical protein